GRARYDSSRTGEECMMGALEGRVLLTTLTAGFSETLVTGLGPRGAPTMAFAPNGRLFVSDNSNGEIHVVEGGKLLSTPFVTLKIDHYAERGINGIAFDPDFAHNRYVYV